MIGRRIPLTDDERIPDWWYDDLRPGDYCGPTTAYTGGKAAVMFLKPNARDPAAPAQARSMQHVTSPPHVFTEMPDGSLQIRESISDRRHGQGPEVSDGWHGYLDAGHVWRQV